MNVCPYRYQVCRDNTSCPARGLGSTIDEYYRRPGIAEACTNAGVVISHSQYIHLGKLKEVPHKDESPDASENY